MNFIAKPRLNATVVATITIFLFVCTSIKLSVGQTVGSYCIHNNLTATSALQYVESAAQPSPAVTGNSSCWFTISTYTGGGLLLSAEEIKHSSFLIDDGLTNTTWDAKTQFGASYTSNASTVNILMISSNYSTFRILYVNAEPDSQATVGRCPSTTRLADLSKTPSVYLLSRSYPSNYPINHKCKWQIRAPSGMTVMLTRMSFSTESSYDVLSIYGGTSSRGHLMRQWSGSYTAVGWLISGCSTGMYLKFISDSSRVSSGFVLHARAVTSDAVDDFNEESCPIDSRRWPYIVSVAVLLAASVLCGIICRRSTNRQRSRMEFCAALCRCCACLKRKLQCSVRPNDSEDQIHVRASSVHIHMREPTRNTERPRRPAEQRRRSSNRNDDGEVDAPPPYTAASQATRLPSLGRDLPPAYDSIVVNPPSYSQVLRESTT